MRIGILGAMAISTLLGACASDGSADEARMAFGAFESALRRGDAATCRTLVTEESRPAIDGLPWTSVTGKQPLVVKGTEGAGAEFRIHVVDPNDGGAPGEFVVVREYGRFVVDLVATAGLTAQFVEAAGKPDDFVPRELSPADHDRIRQHELAQPPR